MLSVTAPEQSIIVAIKQQNKGNKLNLCYDKDRNLRIKLH